jgi:hypothetical protein
MSEQRHHSRVTGAIRLILAAWLMFTAVRTLADPQQAVIEQGLPMRVVLPIAGLSFALGVFLLTGFMSRAAGLVLLCMGAWQLVSVGIGVLPGVLAVVGAYLMLRGGGAWAMDIYVQKMQDRARQKAALSAPEST